MENHQDILLFIDINTEQAAKQVSSLEHLVKSKAFKIYLQELSQKYKAINHTAKKHLEFIGPDSAKQDSTGHSPYMMIEQEHSCEDDSATAELLMQHSVLGIVQIKKQVRVCQSSDDFPHNIYHLLLELLDTEQFNLRCLQAFL